MAASHGKVVARYLDGRLVKGYTFDFGPAQPRFHVFEEPSATGPSTRVLVHELKAVFFVRDFAGDPTHQEGRQFAPGDTGRHIEVTFRDGEVMVGTLDGPATGPPGFFLVPADPRSNNLRVYVVAAAIRAVYPLPDLAPAGPRPIEVDRGRPDVVTPALPGRLRSWLTR
jgi:hypothetical protein